jgi:hypothetical protein
MKFVPTSGFDATVRDMAKTLVAQREKTLAAKDSSS